MTLDDITTPLTALPGFATGGTTGNWVILWLSLLLALGVSFLCSLLEAGLLSVSRSHVEVMVRDRKPGGKTLQRMKNQIDRPLAAILTLNTIAHTVGAAGVGAEVLVIFGSAWVGAASAVVTVLILVLSEIIPKTIGAAHAKPLAPFTALTVQWLIWLTWPIVRALEAISNRLGRRRGTIVTRDEVIALTQLGTRVGALDYDESRIIENLFQLREVRVKDIMTPRTVAFMLPASANAADVLKEHPDLPFSRIPIYAASPDEITGIVLRQDVLRAALEDDAGRRSLASLAQPMHVIPELASVGSALQQFIVRKEHLFIVVDEFGGTAGLVTLEDAIETLLGVEIVDETDSVEDMRRLASRLARRRRGGGTSDGDDA